MPELDLVTADGPLRVFTLLHDARPVLLNLDEPGRPQHHSMGGSGFSWSTPNTWVHGSFRYSARSLLPLPC